MKEYYECHITMIGDPTLIEAATQQTLWKFSCIEGDPDLGDGVKCYATRQYNKKDTIVAISYRMEETAKLIKKKSNCRILRQKIEYVLYDVRGDV